MSTTHATDTTIDLTREYDTPIAEVWRAWTTVEGLTAWYAPVEGWVVDNTSVDLRAGGSAHLEFGPPGGARVVEDWEFTEVEHHATLAYRLHLRYRSSDGEVAEDTEVRVEFRDLGGSTQVRIIESGYTSKEVRDHHQGGVLHMLDSLGAALARGSGS